MKKISLIAALLILFAGAALALENALAERARTPALNFSRYGFDAKKPLMERVSEPPGFVLEFLQKMDERPDYAAHALSREERAAVERQLELLPRGYREILKERLLGLYFVDNFLGSGYTEFVLDEKGRAYSFMAFNSGVLKRGLSDWLTEKENTAFARDTDRVTVSVDCGGEALALDWILLHEATHAADYARHFTPYVEPGVWELQGRPQRPSRFAAGVWEGYGKPLPAVGWPYAGKVNFYGFGQGPGLPLSRAREVYGTLSQTPFASLYATKTWAEDLAEYAAFYHLTRTRGLSYAVRVAEGGGTVFEFRPSGEKNSPCRKRKLPGGLL